MSSKMSRCSAGLQHQVRGFSGYQARLGLKAHSLKLVRVEATLVQKRDTCCAVCYCLLQTAPNKPHWLSEPG